MECTPLSWDSAFIQSSPFYRCISSGYESRFDSAMMASIEPDMRVFDIGANVGYYTKKFAEAVGSSGEVHAFEPVPASIAKLRELQSNYPWIRVHPCAVADVSGEVLMNIAELSTSPTNRIVLADENTCQSISVPVVSVDQIVADVGLPFFVKIDVEGYELSVLQGASAALAALQLRHVFFEIHFGLLEARGLTEGASDISRIFDEAGFYCKFTDFSHLHAFRD